MLPMLAQFSFSYLEWSKQGKEFYNDIVGFVEFLRLCDEQKLRTLLQEDPLYIDKILPYAIALGMDTVIVKKLKNRFKKKYFHSSFMNDFESLRESSSSIKCSKSSSSTKSTGRAKPMVHNAGVIHKSKKYSKYNFSNKYFYDFKTRRKSVFE